MLKNILGFSKLSLRFLPFVVLCIALQKANLPKKRRYRQLPMIPLAVVFCIILIFKAEAFTSRVYRLIDVLKQWIPILDRFDWKYWTLLATNMLVCGLWLSVKGVLLPIIDSVWALIGETIRRVLPPKDILVYEYDEDENAYYLSENWGQIKWLYFFFYYAVVIYGTLLMVMNYYFQRTLPVFSYRFYPVYGIIIFCEIASCLSGITRSEHEEKKSEEEKKEEKQNDYTGLMGRYLELFRDRILLEEVNRRKDDVSETPEQIVDQLKKSPDNVEKAFGDYLQRELDLGTDMPVEYILSSKDMLHGRSVLFANPFYRDLTGSVFFPFNISLLKHTNGLILLGRDGIENEIRDWLLEGFENVCHVPEFWRIGIISETSIADFDIGILSLKDMNNITVLNRHKAFFSEVGFVLMLEPSRIVTMNQLALSILSYMIESDGKEVVYCGCDRNTDGAVDALSHILRTSITQVGATVASSKLSTVLAWNIDGDFLQHKLFRNIVRYLGGGISIASVSLKHGIDKVSWYADQSMPVEDIRWIAGQYYAPITEYAGLISSQDSLYRSIHFESNLWGSQSEKDQCLIVEDEYCNLFEAGRQFSTRAREQTFLHVLTSNYMLRDYMCANPAIFKADPKAIPQIVADFARTRRNCVMQLIMLLIGNRVSDTQIEDLFASAQIHEKITRDLLDSLIGEFYDVSGYGALVCELDSEDEYDTATADIVQRKIFTISNDRFVSAYASELRTAYYLSEDDEAMEHFLGGRLKGQVYQTFLPGQFVTLSGKYYEVLGIETRGMERADMLVVRRAADHITNRRYYRQLRTYRLDKAGWENHYDKYRSERTLGGTVVSSSYIDMTVSTRGFLEMNSFNNLARASKSDIQDIPDRVYRRKYALRIILPNVTDQVRTQITLMMNEVFRTVFPECYEYITAATDTSWNTELSSIGLTSVTGNCDKEAIYILEDSQIDLGLTIAVERYLLKILQIICDYCDWQLERIREDKAEAEEDDVATGETGNKEGILEEGSEKKSFIRRCIDRIQSFFGKLFKRRKKTWGPSESNTEEKAESNGEENVGEGTQDSDVEQSEAFSLGSMTDCTTGSTFDGEEETGTVKRNEGQSSSTDDGVDTASDGTSDSEATKKEEFTKAGRQAYYLQFGFDRFPDYIDVQAVYDYLASLGIKDNPFGKVRKGTDIINEIEKTYHPEDKSRVICDFCGVDVTGMEHDVLKDGRCRCPSCTASAVKTIEEFSDIFLDVRQTMERQFGIDMNIPIKVKMVSATTLARVGKYRFRPSNGFDSRYAGLAVADRGGYTLFVENGAPEDNTRETIAHELTHIWQFKNWNYSEIVKKHGRQGQKEIYEGMAVWVSIRYMMLTNRIAHAKRSEIGFSRRNDEYGIGYLRYQKKYGSACEIINRKKTPFREADKVL